MDKPARTSEYILSSEEIKNISALTDTLQMIRARLLADGVDIEAERERLLRSLED